jgi:hypothetical protein
VIAGLKFQYFPSALPGRSGKEEPMTHMPEKRALIQAGWKPGTLAKDMQGRRVEVLSNPCWDDSCKGFRILIRYCLDERTRMAELNALSLA